LFINQIINKKVLSIKKINFDQKSRFFKKKRSNRKFPTIR
jgi:hypothetical protein